MMLHSPIESTTAFFVKEEVHAIDEMVLVGEGEPNDVGQHGGEEEAFREHELSSAGHRYKL